MATAVPNRVRESTINTGSGLTLNLSAVAGRKRFSSQSVGTVVPYVLEDADGIHWELGHGTVQAGHTFDRTTVTESTNANARIVLSVGTHAIYVALETEDLVYQNSASVISALGYTPYSNANPSGFISAISGAMVIAALGFTPFANPMTTGGDLIYGGASGVANRLPNGNVGELFLSGGGTAAPVWSGAGLTFDKVNSRLAVPAVDFAEVYCPNALPGAYTLANSGIVFKNAAGDEVLRIWGTDPDVINDYNGGNLYIGLRAGEFATTNNTDSGYENNAIGMEALRNISTGAFNNAFGHQALSSNSSGSANVGVGDVAMYSNTSGYGNSGFGDSGLFYNTIGGYNVGVGFYAGIGTSEGSDPNQQSTIDTHMLFLGDHASRSGQLNSIAMTNGIAIGSGALVLASNHAVIGNSSLTDAYFGSESAAAKIHAAAASTFGGSALGSAAFTSSAAYDAAGAASSALAIALAADSIFTAADFNVSGVAVSLDYTNGQKATGSQPGFLSAADFATFAAAGSPPFSDATALLKDNSDATKLALFECSGITTGTTRTYTLPNVSDTLAVKGANTFIALQTIAQASANAGILASTGYSLTGSNASNMLDFAATLNTSGNPILFKIAATNTASGGSAKFVSFLAGASGATEVFSVTLSGNVVIAGLTATTTTLGTTTMGNGTFGVYGADGSGSFYNGGILGWSSNSVPTGTKDIGFMRSATGRVSVCDGATVTTYRDLTLRQLYPDFTNTATVGAVTINKSAGQCIVASGATSVVVTNNLVTANSQVLCTVAQNDTTATIKNCVAASGSFTVTITAAATADCKINFLVLNQ